MIRPQLTLDLHHELAVDGFAGGGGFSTGWEMATGRHIDHAMNHAWDALGMHRINHPQTVHHCEDIFDVDPATIAEGRPVGYGHFSPDCKHFSKAKGGRPLDKRIRGLAFVILRWAKIRTRVISMENVEEIKTWGPLLPDGHPDKRHTGRTWRAFLDALGGGVDPAHPDLPEMLDVLAGSVTREELVRGFGYAVESRELRACDYGSPTIRKRLFMIARCDGQPIVWPAPTHAAPDRARALGLRPYRTVAEQIDWSLPCHSIFLSREEARAYRCKRPLAPATLRRIATGIDRYVLKASRPFLVNLTHQGGDRVEGIDEPARTLTAANRGEKALCDVAAAPFVSEHANASSPRNMPADEPGRTQCAEVKGGHFSLVSASLCREFGESIGQAVDCPAPTVMPGGGGKSSLTSVHLTKFNTGSVGGEVSDPAPTIPAGSHHEDTRGGAAAPLGIVGASLIRTAHGEQDSNGKKRGKGSHSIQYPSPTILSSSDGAIAAATLVQTGYGERDGQAPRALDIEKPGGTAVAGGCKQGLCAAYLAQHNAGNATNPGHSAHEPTSTISQKGSQQQVVVGNLAAYYGNDQDGQGMTEPCRTVTTKERFGFCKSEAVSHGLTPEQLAGALRVADFLREHGVEFDGEFATVTADGIAYVIVDIGMRMLTPRELFRCQGFPDSYVIDRAWIVNPQTGHIEEITLTKEQQIRMCGNSVCPQVAAAIVRANVPEMAAWFKGERTPVFA